MSTDVLTLTEYAALLTDLAEDWEGEDPVVLIGDIAAESLSVTAKDGYTTFGDVGYAQECFDGNGVMQVGNGDTRFFGTMLFNPDDLPDDVVEQAHQEAER